MMWSCKFCFKPWNVVYFLQETEEASTEEEEEKPKITVCNACLWTFIFFKFKILIIWFLVCMFVFLFLFFFFLCVCIRGVESWTKTFEYVHRTFMAPANSHPQLLRDMFMKLRNESLDLKVCCWEWLAGGGCKDRTHGLSFSYYKPGQTLLHSLQ
jgi:hypothetical protein